MNNHCCEAMEAWIQDTDCPFSYSPKIRYYTMSAPKSLMKQKEVWPCYKVKYCPHCSTKLPNNVVDAWMDILEKEYGIDDPYDPKQKKLIPAEFKTDEWWKKRGL